MWFLSLRDLQALRKTHTHTKTYLFCWPEQEYVILLPLQHPPLPTLLQLTLLFYLTVSLHQSKVLDCSQEPCFRNIFFSFVPFCCSITSLAPLESRHTLPRCSGTFPKDLYTEQVCIWQTQCYLLIQLAQMIQKENSAFSYFTCFVVYKQPKKQITYNNNFVCLRDLQLTFSSSILWSLQVLQFAFAMQ